MRQPGRWQPTGDAAWVWINTPATRLEVLYQVAAMRLLRLEARPCPKGEPGGRGARPRELLRVPVDRIVVAIHAKGAVVTYLIVGLDRKTHARWHGNVTAGDIGMAKCIARARATEQGIDLVVAAVIGPNSAVVPDPAEERPAGLKAA